MGFGVLLGWHLSCPYDRGCEPHQDCCDIDGVCVEVEVLGYVEHVQQGGHQHRHSGPEHHHEGGRQPAVEGKQNVDYSTPATHKLLGKVDTTNIVKFFTKLTKFSLCEGIGDDGSLVLTLRIHLR